MLGLYPVAVVRTAEAEVLAQMPEGTLMHRAAFGLAVECSRLLREATGSVSGSVVAVLVGAGNNGGDALFAAAQLQRRGAGVVAYTLADRWHQAGARALLGAGGRIKAFSGSLIEADMIIDGVVGIGARGPLREPARSAVLAANASDALRVAVDIPSGVDVDHGSVLDGVAFEADMTVTFGCAKPGLFLSPGAGFSGAVRIVDIGLETALPEPMWQVMAPTDVLDHFQGPEPDDYKYTRGVVGVAAGSARYPGAAVLTIGGARYAGVGMTAIVNRRDGVAADAVRAYPDVVTLEDDPRKLQRVRAWVCGPGFIGDSSDAELIRAILECPVPVVLDAGALTTLAYDPTLQELIRERHDRGEITVLTPHAGEFRSLFGRGDGEEHRFGAIVVRKGPGTVTHTSLGSGFVDVAGTEDLACAGSGDVLAGLIGGVLARRGLDRPTTYQAGEMVAAAVWLHGLVGRLAASDDRPVLATDLVRVLPDSIAELRRGTV